MIWLPPSNPRCSSYARRALTLISGLPSYLWANSLKNKELTNACRIYIFLHLNSPYSTGNVELAHPLGSGKNDSKAMGERK